jgi:hypothetical protein
MKRLSFFEFFETTNMEVEVKESASFTLILKQSFCVKDSLLRSLIETTASLNVGC